MSNEQKDTILNNQSCQMNENCSTTSKQISDSSKNQKAVHVPNPVESHMLDIISKSSSTNSVDQIYNSPIMQALRTHEKSWLKNAEWLNRYSQLCSKLPIQKYTDIQTQLQNAILASPQGSQNKQITSITQAYDAIGNASVSVVGKRHGDAAPRRLQIDVERLLPLPVRERASRHGDVLRPHVYESAVAGVGIRAVDHRQHRLLAVIAARAAAVIRRGTAFG